MNKPEFYPYVLLPEEIEKIKIEGIPVPEIQELLAFPVKTKKRFLGTIILFVSIAVILTISLTKIIESNFLANIITYLAFFIGIVSLTASVFEILHNGKIKKQYKIALKLYNELKIEQEELKRKRSQAIDDNTNPKAIEAYRHDAIIKYFRYSYNKIQAVQREHTAAQKRFIVFLEQYFEGKILENIRLIHESKGLDYSPDFVIKINNPKVNIAIDIEEPYLFDGTKIVVKKNRAEESFKKRYRVTHELRWVSIVFNEEQIVTHPSESCKLIAHTIDEILLKEKYSLSFKNIEKLKRVEIPGQRELSAYIKNKHREKYLTAAGLIDGLDFDLSQLEVPKKEEKLSEKEEKSTQENKNKDIKQPIDKNKEEKIPEKEKIIDLKNDKTQDYNRYKEIITEPKFEKNQEPEIEQLQIVKKVTEKLRSEKFEKEKKDSIDKELPKKEKKEQEKIEKTAETKLKTDKEKDKKLTTVAKKGQLKREADILNKLYSTADTQKEKIMDDANKEQLEKEQQEIEHRKKEKAEQERLEKERLVNEKLEKEQLEKERLEKEKLEKIKLEKERLDIEKLQKELDKKTETEANNKLMEQYKKQIEDLVLNRDWDKLFDKCTEVINEFPYWDWPYYRRSTVHGNQGKFDEVLEDCNKALALNPKSSDAYYNRATAKFFLEKYQQAADDYQKSIDLKCQNSAEAYFNKGLCYQNMDYHKNAYKEFLKAKDLGSNKAIEVIKRQYAKEPS